MLNIVLFGPPGAGKGTQSEKLIKAYNLVHFSTGDILRAEVSAGTDLGMKAKELMDAGNLVPDEVVIAMISNKIDQNLGSKGFIFDGFPRTTAQAVALDRVLIRRGMSITKMLALQVEDEELKKRLLERGKISGRVDDSDVEKINNRIKVYKDQTLPVAEYYEKQGKYAPVNGVGAIEEIFERLNEHLNQKV